MLAKDASFRFSGSAASIREDDDAVDSQPSQPLSSSSKLRLSSSSHQSSHLDEGLLHREKQRASQRVVRNEKLVEQVKKKSFMAAFLATFAGASSAETKRTVSARVQAWAARTKSSWMYYAASSGLFCLLRPLIQCSADVTTTEDSGVTALHVAACNGARRTVQALIDAKASVNAGADREKSFLESSTPLHMAIMNKQLEVVNLLVKSGADLDDTQGQDQNSCLHLAVYSGSTEIVDFICEEINAMGQTLRLQEGNILGQTPLHLAAQSGNTSVTEALIKNFREGAGEQISDKLLESFLSMQDGTDWTALHEAALHGHADVMQSLLENRIDVEAKGATSVTALHLAAGGENLQNSEDSANCVKLLLDARADMDAVTDDQHTALHIASQSGHIRRVVILCEHGCSLEKRNVTGYTALHEAAYKGHWTVVEHLCEQRADVAAKCEHVPSPLHLAINAKQDPFEKLTYSKVYIRNQQECNTEIPCKQCIIALHRAGADLEAGAGDHGTPLHDAAMYSRHVAIQQLCELRAELEAVDRDGHTPLQKAALFGQQTSIDALHKLRADLERADSKGRTPLHLAAEVDHADTVQFLIHLDADVNTIDQDQNSPMDKCCQRSRTYYFLQKKRGLSLLDEDGEVLDSQDVFHASQPRSLAMESDERTRAPYEERDMLQSADRLCNELADLQEKMKSIASKISGKIS
mmetsp:Transcript_148678/g.277068  ORF Transcript_148678/g.277068 Transcript_148678/m.277068 type:complete len:696 (-) Transcript_148678:99-2186(-)